MIWAHLTWREEAAPIRRQLRLRKREPNSQEREVLERCPPMDAITAIGLKAFNETTTCRQIGFGLGPIPQSAIDAWCDRRGLDLEAADILADAVRYVDTIFLEREASKHRVNGAKP